MPNVFPLYDFKHPRRRLSQNSTRTSLTPDNDCTRSDCTRSDWWSLTGSNRRPPECKSGALPAELRPLLGEAKELSFSLKRRRGRPSPEAFPRISADARSGLRRCRVEPAPPSCEGRPAAGDGSPGPKIRWWAWDDSNVRPHPYQGCALTT
jgi:hypothetical protein